jgi:hypothetical protein
MAAWSHPTSAAATHIRLFRQLVGRTDSTRGWAAGAIDRRIGSWPAGASGLSWTRGIRSSTYARIAGAVFRRGLGSRRRRPQRNWSPTSGRSSGAGRSRTRRCETAKRWERARLSSGNQKLTVHALLSMTLDEAKIGEGARLGGGER